LGPATLEYYELERIHYLPKPEVQFLTSSQIEFDTNSESYVDGSVLVLGGITPKKARDTQWRDVAAQPKRRCDSVVVFSAHPQHDLSSFNGAFH
jgi:hypothetical protein